VVLIILVEGVDTFLLLEEHAVGWQPRAEREPAREEGLPISDLRPDICADQPVDFDPARSTARTIQYWQDHA
jgi:hypothetical protein